MVTATWRSLTARIAGAPSRQTDGLKRVGTRLAVQTVALLLVMLIALEVVVYLITQQTLIGSLETTLKSRANTPDAFISNLYHVPGGQSARGGGQGRQGPQPGGPSGSDRPPFANPDLNPSDASSAYISPNLHIIHADGALGMVLLDPLDARRVLRTGVAQCCSVQGYKGQDYLIYTKLLYANGAVIGAVQTSISEHQYEQTMALLLRALLVVALLGLITSGGVSAILVSRALKPVRAAVKRQRDFVADAAHELRTPLAIQRTVGEVGMADLTVEGLQGTVAQMLGENQHLARLVENLSLLARTDTNTVRIEHHTVDLTSLVTETIAELEPLAEAQGVTLTVQAEGDVRVMGDVLRLRQLLLILVDNALKHTPTGGNASVGLSSQGSRIRLQVADSGPGIDPNDLPRIFDRFYRADRARAGEGTGLGLAIGKWIAEAHGGQIRAGNASPHGALFTVTLPGSDVATR